MKTLSAIYKGDRTIELAEEPALAENTPVLVLIPGEDDETEMRTQLQRQSETVFVKLWSNEGDEVWDEYL